VYGSDDLHTASMLLTGDARRITLILRRDDVPGLPRGIRLRGRYEPPSTRRHANRLGDSPRDTSCSCRSGSAGWEIGAVGIRLSSLDLAGAATARCNTSAVGIRSATTAVLEKIRERHRFPFFLCRLATRGHWLGGAAAASEMASTIWRWRRAPRSALPILSARPFLYVHGPTTPNVAAGPAL